VLAAGALAPVTSASEESAAATIAARPAPGQVWVAKVIYPTLAHSEPSGTSPGVLALSTQTQWGTPVELLVIEQAHDRAGNLWLRVRVDYRPNGLTAWIYAGNTVLSPDPWMIGVSLEKRLLRVFEDGHLRWTFGVVVGKPSTPTPTGLFAIAAELRQPDSEEFEGSWVMPLTAHSEVLQSFEGGDGQVALHGRGGASLADPLGTARSHGCVRMLNRDIGWLARHVPAGTPVRIN